MVVDSSERLVGLWQWSARDVKTLHVRRQIKHMNLSSFGPSGGNMLFLLLRHHTQAVDTAVMRNGSVLQDRVLVQRVGVIFIVRV